MKRLAAASLIVMAAALIGRSESTLLDYEKRVVRAREQVERMKKDREFAQEDVATIKKLLPGHEDVSSHGQSIKTDNVWLFIALDTYLAEKDPQKAAKKLEDVRGQLKALDDELRKALEEPASNPPGPAREKIGEILSRAEFQPKQMNPIAAFIKRVKDEVVALIEKLYVTVFNAIFGQGAEANPIYRAVIILALIGVVVAAARMAMGLRRGEKKRKKKRVVLGEEIEAGVTSSDLAAAAIAAARAGDFRTGMRKLYIALLYELADRNLVELERDVTNHEYLAQVARFKPLAAPMGYLTDRFDYFWYGMFPSSEEDFSSYFVRYKEALESARTLRAAN